MCKRLAAACLLAAQSSIVAVVIYLIWMDVYRGGQQGQGNGRREGRGQQQGMPGSHPDNT